MSKIGGGWLSASWAWLRRPSARFSLLTLVAAGFAGGIVFWGGFNTAMEATNTLEFCVACHEMQSTVFQEYKSTIHFQNRTGVRAICSDCHVPDPWVHKVARKIQATNELFHWATGSVNTAEKFEAKRLELAQRVWSAMKSTDSRECRNCHTLQSMNPEFQRPRARKQHLDAMSVGQTCIDCHKGIAHKNVRDKLAEADLERIEKPEPAYIRAVPAEFAEGLRRVTGREAAEAKQKQREADAAEAALRARIDQAVATALAASAGRPGRPAATGTATPVAASGAASGFGVDWDKVEAKTVPLFYPGQASFEWVQTGKDHGGARAFTRGGDRCATCHLKEVADMGAKIVSGQKAESTPIPGKRGSIQATLRASHDGSNLYLRMQWPDAPHAPVPFVAGGKMDPENQVKLAVMIAGTGIERVEQAGCWATCHHDSRSMPDAPKADVTKASPLAGRLDLKVGVTKYLAESRTQVEVQGRGEQPRGGWDKLKPAEDIAGLLKNGTYMDLLRVRSGAGAENGQVLDQRIMSGGAALDGEASLSGGVWTVTLRRPLKSDKPGDVSLEPGKTYVVGFAIHDDFAAARFHHVSLEYTLGLDQAEADINVRKR